VVEVPDGAVSADAPVAYSVNLGGVFDHLRQKIVLDIAESRFGVDAMKIVGLLQERIYIPDDKIYDNAIMPHRMCREITYQLHSAGWLQFHEVSTRADFNPNGTTYLIHLNMPTLVTALSVEMFHAVYNMRLRQTQILERYRAHVPVGTDVVLSEVGQIRISRILSSTR